MTNKVVHKAINGGVGGLKARAKNAGIKVGILAGTGEHPQASDGQTTAEIAFWNEFGTRNADGSVRIPERPFMRSTIRSNQKAYADAYHKLLKLMLLNKVSVATAENRLGMQAQRDIKATIVAFKDPGNAPLTILLKGRDNPLEFSGHMRNSIHWARASRGQ